MPRTIGGIIDVTGGMGGKLTECVTALRNNVSVFVVSLLDRNRLLDVACGHNTICSEILL
jgi:isopentenyl phosphate kinase